MKNEELQSKLEALANKKIDDLSSINENNKSLIENIQSIVYSKSESSGSHSLDSINQFLSTLNFEQTPAIMHISFYFITLIYFGDYFIKYFNLEVKYPKIANFIKYRRKFQNYYVLVYLIIIVLILIFIIYINLLLLLTPYYYKY